MKAIAAVLLIVVMYIIIAALLAIPTMLLWDWLMPAIFGLKKITLFQAWGINFLSTILFKTNPTAKTD